MRTPHWSVCKVPRSGYVSSRLVSIANWKARLLNLETIVIALQHVPLFIAGLPPKRRLYFVILCLSYIFYILCIYILLLLLMIMMIRRRRSRSRKRMRRTQEARGYDVRFRPFYQPRMVIFACWINFRQLMSWTILIVCYRKLASRPHLRAPRVFIGVPSLENSIGSESCQSWQSRIWTLLNRTQLKGNYLTGWRLN